MQSPHVRCWGNNGSRISVLRLVFRRRLARARGKLEHRRCRALTTQLPKRAFIAKHLNIGSGAARPATPDTTSSGKALNGDFTNTAHQRSTRPTIAFARQIAMGVVSKTDENGNFIVEACGQPNMKMARHFLEWQRPEKWGKRRKRHVPHNAGELVIGGDVTKKPEYDTTASVKARKWKSFSRKFREAKT